MFPRAEVEQERKDLADSLDRYALFDAGIFVSSNGRLLLVWEVVGLGKNVPANRKDRYSCSSNQKQSEKRKA
jgi:hypothetical protein